MVIVPYEDLLSDPNATIHHVLSHLRHEVDPAMMPAMLESLATYAKDPAHRALFDPVGRHGRPPLSESQAEEVQQIVDRRWRELERLANAQKSGSKFFSTISSPPQP
jgi:hypothetical protein